MLLVASMLVNGLMVKKKVKVFLHGLMAIVMTAATKMIWKMVMEQKNILMVESMLVNGLMIKKKVKVFLHGEKEVNELAIVMKAA